jgi:hypothetical protein
MPKNLIFIFKFRHNSNVIISFFVLIPSPQSSSFTSTFTSSPSPTLNPPYFSEFSSMNSTKASKYFSSTVIFSSLIGVADRNSGNLTISRLRCWMPKIIDGSAAKCESCSMRCQLSTSSMIFVAIGVRLGFWTCRRSGMKESFELVLAIDDKFSSFSSSSVLSECERSRETRMPASDVDSLLTLPIKSLIDGFGDGVNLKF